LSWGATGADVTVLNADLVTDDGLQTAVVISLFTDRRVTAEELPDGETDLRGFWGDVSPPVAGDKLGSKLWLLAREKATTDVLARAREYAEESLAWLVEDQVASSVTVTTEYLRPGLMAMAIIINRPSGETVNYRYDYNWQQQLARAS